jgi:hypothetical protein
VARCEGLVRVKIGGCGIRKGVVFTEARGREGSDDPLSWEND